MGRFSKVRRLPARRVEDPASILASQIKQATRSIDVAMFTFSERKLQDALVDALKRGLKVRLVAGTRYSNEDILIVKDQDLTALEHARGRERRVLPPLGNRSRFHHEPI